jgi:hypothetical protein
LLENLIGAKQGDPDALPHSLLSITESDLQLEYVFDGLSLRELADAAEKDLRSADEFPRQSVDECTHTISSNNRVLMLP